MHIFHSTAFKGYMFVEHCSSGGGHDIFIYQTGGYKYIAGVLSEIYDPHSIENDGPLIIDDNYIPQSQIMDVQFIALNMLKRLKNNMLRAIENKVFLFQTM